MNNKEYIEKALRTESSNLEEITQRLTDPNTVRALHASLGVVTEAAELADALKKHIFYGKPIDWVNLEEEAGDLFWYLAILADTMGKDSFDGMMQKNIDKLTARYKNKSFTEENAIVRDLITERSILEDK